MFNKNRVYILLSFLLLLIGKVSGQARTIFGRVIDEELATFSHVRILDNDHNIIGQTGDDGRFSVIIPLNTKKLFFSLIGYQLKTVTLNDNCDTVEIILLASYNYHLKSSKKIDRLRLKQFNKAKKLHLEAFNKGIFFTKSVCYSTEFQPQKPSIDSIQKEMAVTARINKSIFEKLNIGDTIKIPFVGTYRANGTDRINLNPYSAFTKEKDYDYLVEGVITNKNKLRNGYNLVYKVTHCDFKDHTAVFENRNMIPGEVFNHNMKYYKVLAE